MEYAKFVTWPTVSLLPETEFAVHLDPVSLYFFMSSFLSISFLNSHTISASFFFLIEFSLNSFAN